VTYADYEVITPPDLLRDAASEVPEGEAHDDPVARAEAALGQLSGEFGQWMKEECDRLHAARSDAVERGMLKEVRDELFFAAHDIKGDAATFGYPFASAAADSLCRLIEHSPDAFRIPIKLIDQHVDAIRAIVRESARPEVAMIANSLTSKLRQVTDGFLADANKHRPEYLAEILA
jgi:hypothetical protein